MTLPVTVLMPVYNGEKYLREAIESILMQSFSDFEFLIVNDGSTDNSSEIIGSYFDERICIINNRKNIGQANSLNIGMKCAQGEYIVRMDADDISCKDRINKQVKFMDLHPEIGISGTWVKTIGYECEEIWKTSTDPNLVKCQLLFHSPIVHPSVIMRKSFLENNCLFYNPLCETAEDYELWIQAARIFPITNLGEVLLFYRMHTDRVSYRSGDKQKQVVDYISIELLKQLDLFPNISEFEIHKLIGRYHKFNTQETILEAKNWLEKLDNANAKKKVFPVSCFSEFLSELWFRICFNTSHLGIWAFKAHYNSKLNRYNKIDLKKKLMFFIKCAVRHA